MQHPNYKEDWDFYFDNEIGRLAQGIPVRNTSANTLHFVNQHIIPASIGNNIAYTIIVCNIRPQKVETNFTRLTFSTLQMGVDIDCGTSTSSVLTIELLISIIISTQDAKFMSTDITDFYLNTPLNTQEFLQMKLAYFPNNVIEH